MDQTVPDNVLINVVLEDYFMASLKERIDNDIKHNSMRRLMYWKHAYDPSCAAEVEDTYCAGNMAFSNDVCELLDYAKMLEDLLNAG